MCGAGGNGGHCRGGSGGHGCSGGGGCRGRGGRRSGAHRNGDEFALPPFLGLVQNRDVTQEKVGVTASAADSRPESDFAARSNREGTGSRHARAELVGPHEIRRTTVAAGWRHEKAPDVRFQGKEELRLAPIGNGRLAKGRNNLVLARGAKQSDIGFPRSNRGRDRWLPMRESSTRFRHRPCEEIFQRTHDPRGGTAPPRVRSHQRFVGSRRTSQRGGRVLPRYRRDSGSTRPTGRGERDDRRLS